MLLAGRDYSLDSDERVKMGDVREIAAALKCENPSMYFDSIREL